MLKDNIITIGDASLVNSLNILTRPYSYIPNTRMGTITIPYSYVGIGVTAPKSRLHILGDVRANNYLLPDGSPAFVSLWTQSGSNIYYNSGNVGIGSSSPTAKLEVFGNQLISSSGNTSSTENFKILNSDGSTIFQALDNGNIGINGNAVTSTSYRLRVYGGIWADSFEQLKFLRGASGVGRIEYYNNGGSNRTLGFRTYGSHPSESVKGFIEISSQVLTYSGMGNVVLHSDPDFLDHPTLVIRSLNTSADSFYMQNYHHDQGALFITKAAAGGNDSMRFRPGRGSDVLEINSSGIKISGILTAQLTNSIYSNQVYYDSVTGELTYGPAAPTSVTLSDISQNSLITADSLYQMSIGVPVEFRTSGANPLLYLNGNASVGINKVPNSTVALDISGEVVTDDHFQVSRSANGVLRGVLLRNNSSNTGRGQKIEFLLSGNGIITNSIQAVADGIHDTSLRFHTSDGTNYDQERVRITGAGDVGIGTSSPNSKLDINIPLAASDGITFNTNDEVYSIWSNSNLQGLAINANNVGNTSRYDLFISSNGDIGIGTTSLSEKLTVDGNIFTSGNLYINNTILSNQENADVDIGTETIATVAIADYNGAFFDYVIKNGTDLRVGTVYAVHDGTNVEYTEISTQDLGDTTDVTLSVDISGTDLRLLATTVSNDWVIKTLVRAI